MGRTNKKGPAGGKFMPDYGPGWWVKRWLKGIWWRWVSKKPPIVH